MEKNSAPQNPVLLKTSWKKMIAPYQHAELLRSLAQLANTLLPFLALWALMYFSLQVSYLLTLLLAFPTAAFMVRLFIIFHDLGHGSFFKSRSANRLVGFLVGILVFTPSEHWWHEHALHHATSGNLDKRGHGDVTTMTLQEYQQSSPRQQLAYRLFRHPLVMFGLGPIYTFLINHRIPTPTARRPDRLNVFITDLILVALIAGLCWLIGWQAFLMIQLPVLWLAGAAGIWLFYLQHQFEDAYWVHDGQWDYYNSAMLGASYYQLPRLLQWFSGNIGFHNIHHLSPRIPNYFLPKCYADNPALHAEHSFDMHSGLKSLSMRLWDEQAHKMVGFQAGQPAKS